MENESGGREGPAREHRSWVVVVAKGIQDRPQDSCCYKWQAYIHSLASSLTPTGPKHAL